MFSHVTLGVADLDRARRFYEPLLAALGLGVMVADDRWIIWRDPASRRPLFLVTLPFDDGPATPGNGTMVAFLAGDRALVDRCHAVALATGGTDEGAPGLRPHYHPDYYGAYVRDPDGNKLCIACHAPAP